MWFFYTFRCFRYYLWAVRSITQLLEFTVEIGYGNRLVFTVQGVTRSLSLEKNGSTYNANARGDVFRTARHNKFKINARPQMENIDKRQSSLYDLLSGRRDLCVQITALFWQPPDKKHKHCVPP
jgi:hypothetical protein